MATTDDDKTAICEALENLIDECTLILGWCYSEDHVKETKIEQRDLSRAALAKMHIYCPEKPDNETTNHLPEDQFAEKAQLSSPLKPAFVVESSSTKLVSNLFFVTLISIFIFN